LSLLVVAAPVHEYLLEHHNIPKYFEIMYRPDRFKRKKQRRSSGPLDLQGKISEAGGQTGLALEIDSTNVATAQDASQRERRAAGIYGQRTGTSSSSFCRTRLFRTPKTKRGTSTIGPRSAAAQTTSSRRSRFSSAFSAPSRPFANMSSNAAVHVVCAVSENLARETCVSSLDAGSPTTLQVTKQGNGQTYAETLAYLEILKPDEILLNEGRRNSQLARKVMKLFKVDSHAMELPSEGRHRNARHRTEYEEEDEKASRNDESEVEGRYGSVADTTVVKFISRSCFDQTKGAELLRRISREETYDATVVEEYILLSSAHAVLHYTQQSLGASPTRNRVYLIIKQLDGD
jgi:hypothetical protein